MKKALTVLVVATCSFVVGTDMATAEDAPSRGRGESPVRSVMTVPFTEPEDGLPETFEGAELADQPAIDETCAGKPVFTALHVAKQYATMARDRLDGLAKLSEDARKKAWNGGMEKTWFGKYSKGRWSTARKVMASTAQLLGSRHLTIECDPKLDAGIWAKTFENDRLEGLPRSYTIVLGRPWLTGKVRKSKNGPEITLGAKALGAERAMTLVHEASHHGGANRGEALKRYGAANALKRARKYPGTAVRTAENHGLFAVCRASSSARCH